MRARFAGWHPLYVALTVGDDWSAFAQEPIVGDLACIALRPRDMSKTEAIDFRCLVGAAVTVFDQVGAAGELDAPIGVPQEASGAPFFNLLHAIAQLSGPLTFVTSAPIYDVPPGKPPHQVAAWRYAHDCKAADPQRQFPWWWPEQLDKLHGEKIAAWCTAARGRARSAGAHSRAA